MILSVGTPLTLRFKAVTNTIPIIAVTGDPIRFGIVSNLPRPGGNKTGVTVDAGVEIWGKRLEILAEAVPRLVHVVYISTRGNLNSAGGKATQEVAQKLGISLVSAPLNSPVNEAEYRRAFDSIQRDQVDGIIFSAEFEHQPHRFLLIQLVQQIRLPALHIFPDEVEAGGLMSYALDVKPAFRTMAMQTAEILNGVNPGDMPYVQVVRFELAINLKTAKALGLELPATLVARADRVIEQDRSRRLLGTFRTWRDVRIESVIHIKADVRQSPSSPRLRRLHMRQPGLDASEKRRTAPSAAAAAQPRDIRALFVRDSEGGNHVAVADVA